MPSIKNIRLDITPGNSASEVVVCYDAEFTSEEIGHNFVETVYLFAHDRNTLNYIQKIIGTVANGSPLTATSACVVRRHSAFFSNVDMNEDPSYKDDFYADIFIAPVGRSGSGRSNIISRKF